MNRRRMISVVSLRPCGQRKVLNGTRSIASTTLSTVFAYRRGGGAGFIGRSSLRYKNLLSPLGEGTRSSVLSATNLPSCSVDRCTNWLQLPRRIDRNRMLRVHPKDGNSGTP